MTSLLHAEGLAKTYRRAARDVAALRDFDLRIQPGERLGLLGPNGAGKSTLLRILTRLCAPDAGAVRFQGEDLAQRHLAGVGLLLEGRAAANERLTARENARYLCGLREQRFDAGWLQRLAALLELPDLDAPIRQFSTGNRLRAGLLLSCIHRPPLLLLDEPTLGLDVFGVERLQQLVRLLQGEGAAVLLSSHDLGFVEQTAERIVCIHQGRKRFDGARADFVPAGSGYRVCALDGAQWLRWQPPDHAALAALLAELQPRLPQLRQLQVQPLTLAERYRELLEEPA
jgi:ABC-type multidrug transport system ATPase subunit